MSAQLRGVKILAFFQLRALFRFHLLHSYVFLPYSLVPLSLASMCCVPFGSRVWHVVLCSMCVVDSPVAVAWYWCNPVVAVGVYVRYRTCVEYWAGLCSFHVLRVVCGSGCSQHGQQASRGYAYESRVAAER